MVHSCVFFSLFLPLTFQAGRDVESVVEHLSVYDMSRHTHTSTKRLYFAQAHGPITSAMLSMEYFTYLISEPKA